MKTKYILSAAALTLALAACNDDYNDQFDHIKGNDITAAITRDYTLTSDDYKAIAASDVNKALASSFAAADTFPSCSPAELEAIGTNGYFATDTAAQKFLPAFVDSKYSYLGDDGSVVNITYKKYRFVSDYQQMSAKRIGSYTVTSSDYETVWGDEVKASYLTPSTLKDIPSLLAAGISDPKQDSIVMVEYVYDDVEPSIGGGSSEDLTQWQQLSVPSYPDGTNWNYISSGDVDLSKYAGKQVQLAFCYTSTADVAPTWEISDLTVKNASGSSMYEYDLTDEDDYNSFTLEGDIPDGLSYVWSYSSTYGAKASAYAGGTRYASEVYLCSPAISVKDGYTCNFNHALRYYSNDPSTYVKLCARVVSGSKAPRKSHTVSSLGYNAAAAYYYTGSAWKSLSMDETRLVVVDPAAYVQAGSKYFSNPTAQIPTYLSTNYPYASKGDIYTVIYKISSTAYAIADYELGSTTWSQNKNTIKTETKKLKLQKTDGVWVPNGAYYSNSLLGNDGGFVAKGNIPEGLTYIWTNTNSYGWKASAYANSTKYECTAWLISPAISLEGASNPALTFDEAYRYISSPDTADGLLKLFVSADYDDSADDAYASATWTELQMPVRATGESWDFVNVGTIDLSAYKDKTIHIAFRYEATATSAATWEVKNVEIAEQ